MSALLSTLVQTLDYETVLNAIKTSAAGSADSAADEELAALSLLLAVYELPTTCLWTFFNQQSCFSALGIVVLLVSLFKVSACELLNVLSFIFIVSESFMVAVILFVLSCFTLPSERTSKVRNRIRKLVWHGQKVSLKKKIGRIIFIFSFVLCTLRIHFVNTGAMVCFIYSVQLYFHMHSDNFRYWNKLLPICKTKLWSW